MYFIHPSLVPGYQLFLFDLISAVDACLPHISTLLCLLDAVGFSISQGSIRCPRFPFQARIMDFISPSKLTSATLCSQAL